MHAASRGNPGRVPVGVTNSADSNPATSAWVGELLYAPWLNVKIGLAVHALHEVQWWARQL